MTSSYIIRHAVVKHKSGTFAVSLTYDCEMQSEKKIFSDRLREGRLVVWLMYSDNSRISPEGACLLSGHT